LKYIRFLNSKGRREKLAKAKHGDILKVHYTCKLKSGEIIDTSTKGEPLEIKLGDGQVIPSVEKALIGMDLGESKTAKIPAKDAYGPYREDLLIEIDKNRLPQNLSPQVGQRLSINKVDGQKMIVSIAKVSGSRVTLDGNHPLAGKDITVDLKLLEIS
jgi:FKBP-type peptidyl-prolyl cis-trans isomerase 2